MPACAAYCSKLLRLNAASFAIRFVVRGGR